MTAPLLEPAALRRLLTANGIAVQGEMVVEAISGGRSNLTFKVSDSHRTWVARRPPVSGLTPSAHDVVREYTVTHALQDTDVPVAATVACDRDGSILGTPVSVVEFVSGLAIRDQDDLELLTGDQPYSTALALVDILAGLHRVDPETLGLRSFGRPDGFVSRQVALWTSQCERVTTTDLADARSLSTALADAVPAHSDAAIVHGDFRIDNTILDSTDPTTVRAVVDWEMSTLGDPLTDVALMCVYRSPAFDSVLGCAAAWTSARLPEADVLAQRYATSSGRDLAHWGFYLGLAHFKLAVIALGIAHRARLGSDSGPGAAAAADAVPELLSAGLRVLRRGR